MFLFLFLITNRHQPTPTDTDRQNFCTELFTIKDGTRALVGALVGRDAFKKTGGNATRNADLQRSLRSACKSAFLVCLATTYR